MRAHGDALNGLSEPGQSRYALREWRPYLIDAHSMHPPAVSPEHLGCPVQAFKCVSSRVCVSCAPRVENCLVLFSHLTDQKTHSFLTRVFTCVGVRTTAEWRCAEPTSGLGVVPGLYKPKPKPRPASRCRGSNIITRRNLVHRNGYHPQPHW
jgi:hypothetical protein